MVGFGYEVMLIGRELPDSKQLIKTTFQTHRLSCYFNKGKLFYIEFNIRLFIFLLFKKMDALCAIDLDTILPVMLISKLKRIPLVYDAHEYFTEVPEVIRRPLVKRIWQWVEHITVPKATAVYTVSQHIANVFSTKYNKDVKVIYNVPSLTNSIKCKVVTDNFPCKKILYQGALNEGRCIEHLIDAMQSVDGTLLLAGEGDLSAELRQRVREKKLQHKVTFLGKLTPDELREVTASATIGVNLLENKGLNYYYSLANKFFDYAHQGIPQLCVDFPEYRRIVDKYPVALLTDVVNSNTIAFKLNRLLEDHDLYVQLQSNCMALISEYNWEKEEEKLKQCYEQLFR